VQEALSNIARHAHATKVKVTVLGCKTAQVKVSVIDDGVGLSPRGVRDGGSGLVGMRERALLAGGRLEILATSGGGMTVVLTVRAREASAP
jgi:signal transduction histidine kinase